MGDRRQPFRFRLPWLAPQRSTEQQTQRLRPTLDAVSRAPTTSEPASRPAFRPAGRVPAQPAASQPQPPPKAEPQSSSPSPSRVVTESSKETPSRAIIDESPKETSSASTNKSQTQTESPKQTPSVPTTAKAQTSSPAPAATKSPKETPSPVANESRKETPSSTTDKIQTPYRPNESPKEKSSRLVNESTKTTSQSTSKPPSPSSPAATKSPKGTPSPVANEPRKETPSSTTDKSQTPYRSNESTKTTSQSTSKPPSPSSAATKSSKVTQPTTNGKSQLLSASTTTAESPKAISQSIKPQSVEDSKVASQSTSSPSHVVAKSQLSSKPESPPQVRTQSSTTSPPQRDTKSKANAASPYQSRAASQFQPESGKSPQSQSPTSQHARIANLEVSSPTGKATQQKPKVGSVFQSPSSLEKSQGKTQAQLSAYEQEPEREKITSETKKVKTPQDVPVQREQKEVPMPMATTRSVLSKEVVEVAAAPPQKSNLNPLPELEKPEQLKKIAEHPREGKSDKAVHEEPVQKTINGHVSAPISEKDTTKDVHNVPSEAPKRQQKQETSDRKETTTTTSFIANHTKAGKSSHPTEFRKPVSTTEEEEVPLQKEIREGMSKLVQKLTSGSQVDEKPVTVITLTGDNRGATMHMSSEPAKKEASVHIHRGYKSNPDDSPETETATDGEASSRGERHTDQMKREAPSPKAYVNNNVQSVNNSIVFNASIEERNPGVQLTYSQNIAEEVRSMGKSSSMQTRKAEVTITPSEKLTHEPNVRRRCLRGLFMEPSDSDDPEKPRRHGCRYKCGEKNVGEEF
ncbi:hypothetical protein F8388_020987 [Cannabis sativa]|uniref:Proteoglycan 4-like n=1 Tax=Cannabis sativa TaxID=3483 RepID=A0A7J6DS29_CANSA|nr:hypothetical protein G4B88_024098 [Cannabis sativa]KAF4349404.1 hypothetical protein F8388_020987 [Cannabis sativa]